MIKIIKKPKCIIINIHLIKLRIIYEVYEV